MMAQCPRCNGPLKKDGYEQDVFCLLCGYREVNVSDIFVRLSEGASQELAGTNWGRPIGPGSRGQYRKTGARNVGRGKYD